MFLTAPAAVGFSTWLLLPHFSSIYAIFATLWCVVFVEYWKHQEQDLAVRWGVRGVSSIDTKRREFAHEKEMTDPVSGETVQIFPATKRLQRQLLQIPFALGAVLVLGSLIATAFGIEIFISEVYDGPLKNVLVSISPVKTDHSLTTIGLFAHRYSHDWSTNPDGHLYQLRKRTHKL